MRIRTLAGLLAGCSLIFAACGDDAAERAESTTTAAEPVTDDVVETTTTTEAPTDETTTTVVAADATTTTAAAEPAEEPGPPSAIVSLSPTATEMLYAIGAGNQVIAVDDFSNHPPEAAPKMVGVSAYDPSVEAIAGLDPDLVITDGTNPDLLGQLDSLGIAHWEGPAAVTFDDVYVQIEQLGAVTGHVAEAADLVARMQTEIADVIAGLPQLAEPLTYYHELDNTFFSVTSSTFIGHVYDQMGLVNIADAAGEASPYPQLSAEFIITENPDLVFLACTKYCGETAETVAARPGWDALDAVQQGGVIEMDDDIASRWGPRIVDYLRLAGEAVARAAARVGG